jgi:F5/8 type C domain
MLKFQWFYVITLAGALIACTQPTSKPPETPPTNLAKNATLTFSSEGGLSQLDSRWKAKHLIDGNRKLVNSIYGWSSQDRQAANAVEWVIFDLGGNQTVTRADLYPRNDDFEIGEGFPVDFSLDVSSNATTWTTVVTKTGYATPADGAVQTFDFSAVSARYVRLNITKLDQVNSGFYAQLAELELY